MKKILIALMFPITALACEKEVCLTEFDIPCMNQENALYRYLKSVVDEHYSYQYDKSSKDFDNKIESTVKSEIEHCDNSDGTLSDKEKCNQAKIALDELVKNGSGDVERFDYESFGSIEAANKEDARRFMMLFRYEDIDHFHSIVLKEIERLSFIDTRK